MRCRARITQGTADTTATAAFTDGSEVLIEGRTSQTSENLIYEGLYGQEKTCSYVSWTLWNPFIIMIFYLSLMLGDSFEACMIRHAGVNYPADDFDYSRH